MNTLDTKKEKLRILREDWKKASPAYRRLIEQRAKLLKEEITKLEEKKNQDNLFTIGGDNKL